MGVRSIMKIIKELLAELKRSNDLKEKDIKNKEMNGWYMRANTTTIAYSDPWTGGRCG